MKEHKLRPDEKDYVAALSESGITENKKIICIISSFIFSLVIIYAGWSGLLKPEIDTPREWFQRSGSVVVILLLFVDFYINREKTRMNNQFPNKWEGEFSEIFEKYLPIYNFLNIFCIVIAFFGTVIWGYGDLLFMYFS